MIWRSAGGTPLLETFDRTTVPVCEPIRRDIKMKPVDTEKDVTTMSRLDDNS